MKRSKKSLNTKLNPFYLPFIFLFSLILTMCAKVASPPGGPVDETGAEIVMSEPESGAVDVARGDVVSVTFSETVDKNSAQTAVFISPRPTSDPTFKWKGKTMNIILPDSFRDSTTYIVNIGANVADLRNNKMASSKQIAFSTGPEISAGKIKGYIADGGKPGVGVTVGLFDDINPDSLPSFDSLYPVYMTQTGKDGLFNLDYLPDGRYFLLAFGDKDRSQTFDFGQESFGLADRVAKIENGVGPNNLNISMIKIDTTSYDILSIAPNGDGLIKIRFTNSILPDDFKGMFKYIELRPVVDSGATLYHPEAIVEGGDKALQNFTIFFGNLDSGDYQIRIDKKAFGIINDTIPYIYSSKFDLAATADETPPAISFCSHDKQTVFADDNRINLGFSEPVVFSDTGQMPFILLDRDTIGYDLVIDSIGPLLYQLYVPDLSEGQNYTLSINAPEISDRAGNVLGQTIIDYRFSTYDIDSMGSVSGTVVIDTTTVKMGPVNFTFGLYPSMKNFDFAAVRDSFNLNLPPGKYRLLGYVDRNGNGKQDFGSLKPWEWPETWEIYPDTIRIRPRFETAGIELDIK